jgi:NADH-ubiquinone oxidoreductase chain 3
MLFIFVPLLALILLTLNLLLAPHKPDEVKNSAFECGFATIPGQTRSTFTIHFYIVAMLFLIFDLEVMLIYPICLVLYEVSYFGFTIALLFFFILTVGFILEIGSGAISLSNFEVNKINSTYTSHSNEIKDPQDPYDSQKEKYLN